MHEKPINMVVATTWWVSKIDLNRKINSKIRYCESIKFCKLFLKASQFSSENGIKDLSN